MAKRLTRQPATRRAAPRKGKAPYARGERARALDRARSNVWAVRDLEGPPPGPVSAGLRRRLIDEVCEAARVHRGRGVRSSVWDALPYETVVECMVRVVVGGEPAQAVARHVCGVDDPRKDLKQERRARRLQDLLSQLRRRYMAAYAAHRDSAERARRLDESEHDLGAVARHLAIKMGLRLDELLDRRDLDEATSAEKAVLIRMLDSIVASREADAKAGKMDTETLKVRRAIDRLASDEGGGGQRVAPADVGVALDLVTRGVTPTPEAIEARRRELAAAAGKEAA